MKKKTVIIIAVVIAAAAVLLAGFPLFSKLYYGRSQAATLFAWQLQKTACATDEAFDAYIQEKAEENAEAYEAPAAEKFSVSLAEDAYGDMPYYILNGEGSQAQLIVYFAGGSYIDNPREVHWQFLNDLAADTGAAIVVPIYPKLPEADAAASYAVLTDFFRAVIADMAGGELVFMGDSAGGGMALSLAMQLRDAGLAGPDRIVAVCPWLDVTMSNPDIPAYEKKDPALDSGTLARLGALWAGELSETDPVVSPLYGSFEGLGRITLVTTDGELLYPDIMRLDGILTEAGLDHDLITAGGMFHVWPLYEGYSIPEARETYSRIVALLTGG